MKDLIYRQAAIDAVNVGNLHSGIIRSLKSIIEEIPSAQQWIPVSERLPDKEQRCIISVEYPSYMTRRSDVVIDRWVINGGRQIGMFEERSGFWMHHSKQEVTAWLPLPEPYEEGE